MNALFGIDWQKIFVPSISIGEIIVRGTIMYFVLFILLRIVQKRQAGAIGITDLLVIVLLADAAQNGIAGGYESVTEAVVLVGTIIFWNHSFNWLGYRFPQFQRFIYPPSIPLIKNGKMLRQNMKRELITKDELMSQLRQQGISDMSEVQEAHIESDGNISVITSSSQQRQNRPKKALK
ncbi:MAG: DUF421 domain-containing protein [Oscillatoriales cyanobacterium C42_A2020_001]|nr:DUF421 domain-containing protein [Leptolyngbyaceae cyanobacterium C42_A2020_001]